MMEDTTIDTYDISKVNPDKQFDETIVRIYQNYSVDVSDLPKNFVPIIKPKEIIFGNKKEIVPFSLHTFSSEDNNIGNNNNNYIKTYKHNNKIKSHTFNKTRTNRKNTILKKLIEKNQLSKIINLF